MQNSTVLDLQGVCQGIRVVAKNCGRGHGREATFYCVVAYQPLQFYPYYQACYPPFFATETVGMAHLHLAALSDDHIRVRDVLPSVSGLSGLHLLNDFEAIHYLAEDHMLPIEEGGWDRGDEELGAV